ncbi:MAG TPA: tRNA dihydrouridine synthase DusB [Acidobacteriota bacterium]|nr:tRNA dihydrouridine synthase DusB [Acidobacteriota bacterium]
MRRSEREDTSLCYLGGVMEAEFWIRDVGVRGDVILSPMAGFSDLPYRSLCREYGSAMSYTEFVSALAYLAGPNQKTLRMLAYSPAERPMVFQIFDSDEDRIVECARRLEEMKPDIIDLNMGCSVRKVSGRGAGAALLRDPRKIGRIFNRLSKTLKVPVTGKVRLGWDDDELTYVDVVKAMQDNGASLVAVHGRTKVQAYKGEADWAAIARLVEVAQIPVIGNGDVRTREDIERIKAQTGCAAVMVGRGAIGHPWIFRRLNRDEVPFEEKATFLRRHFDSMAEFYGEKVALILVRKHIVRYLKQYSGIKDLYKKLVQIESRQQMEDGLQAVGHRLRDSGQGLPDVLPGEVQPRQCASCG